MTTRRPEQADELREVVRAGYADLAEHTPTARSETIDQASRRMGYDDTQLDEVPEGANLGVGCGNPTAIGSLQPGEVVVDLGAGAGMDAFLAARRVGPSGRVIGVDMTQAMIDRARANAEAAGVDNVEFRLGYIEQLPLDDSSADVIISNCVINLSPEKDRVFAEAHRVLKPGGRLLVSDIVLDRPLPPEVLNSIDAYVGCVGGASLRDQYLQTIHDAGFDEVRVDSESTFGNLLDLDAPELRDAVDRLGLSEADAHGYADAVRSLHVFARK